MPILFRPIEPGDYDLDFFELLNHLTESPQPSKKDFEAHLLELSVTNSIVLVAHDTEKNKIVATGKVFIERKLTHGISSVGHIEDIVTHSNWYKKKSFFFHLIFLPKIGNFKYF